MPRHHASRVSQKRCAAALGEVIHQLAQPGEDPALLLPHVRALLLRCLITLAAPRPRRVASRDVVLPEGLVLPDEEQTPVLSLPAARFAARLLPALQRARGVLAAPIPAAAAEGEGEGEGDPLWEDRLGLEARLGEASFARTRFRNSLRALRCAALDSSREEQEEGQEEETNNNNNNNNGNGNKNDDDDYVDVDVVGRVHDALRFCEWSDAKVVLPHRLPTAAVGAVASPHLVHFLVRRAVDPAVGTALSLFPAKGASVDDVAAEISVVDPAMGNGDFLLAAFGRIHALLAQAVATRRLSAPNGTASIARLAAAAVYGVGRFPLATSVARARLALAASMAAGDGLASEAIAAQLVCGDALTGSVGEQRDGDGLHWPSTFAHVWRTGGFGVVIGHPPWERIQLSGAKDRSACEPLMVDAEAMAAYDAQIVAARTDARFFRMQNVSMPALYMLY